LRICQCEIHPLSQFEAGKALISRSFGGEGQRSDEVDFCCSRLDQRIDLRHPLAVLAFRMPWQEIEPSMAHAFAKRVRASTSVEDSDLCGTVSGVIGGGISSAGCPRAPLRLIVSLLYLKHAFSECDEGEVERWCETPA
jgi:transposase, IS5 family